ncbi:MAG: PQQ-dependent sugar dehydrogenase [Planctomycetes bacterium]|nr:PQQ-dependent sugar dehydrogenase [Planctomycetota bacterium]
MKCLSIVLLSVALPCLHAQSVPLGFTVETLVANQHGPIALDFLPDGRLLFCEQDTGDIKVLAGGAVATVGTVPGLRVSYSQGLLAMAVDPQWPTRPFLYCYHSSAAAQDLRITRFLVNGDLANATSTNLQLGAAYVVLDGIPDTVPQHEGGGLRFGNDGTLFASFGDDRNECLSQDLTRWNGKIVRLRVDALPTGAGGPPPRASLVPAGNPYSGPGDIAQLVWAHGLRNPFRFHIDPADGAIFVADVGEQTFDEIDRIAVPGQNLGWPWREGSAGYVGCGGVEPPSLAPIAEQPVPAVFLALISLGVYRASPSAPYRFGASYDGDYFYTDHFSGRIWRLHRAGAGWSPAAPVPGQYSVELWATGIAWITDARVGPDGAFYFVERQHSGTGSVGRIRPTTAAFAAFGTGCLTGSPVLAAQTGQVPTLGQTFALRIGQLPSAPGGLAIGMLGFSKSAWGTVALPLSLAGYGMPGCTGLVAPDITMLLANSGGVATWSLTLPNLPPLIGQDFYVQALALDPGRNAAGLVISNGGEGVMR